MLCITQLLFSDLHHLHWPRSTRNSQRPAFSHQGRKKDNNAEVIASKPLASVPYRLQCLLMRLMQYDVEIKYRRCPEMYLADTLSRAYLQQMPPPGKADQEVERIHSVIFVTVSEPQIQEIRQEPATDPVLQSLKALILTGWPSERESVPSELRPYFNIRDELAAQDGVIFEGPKCVIPISLRPKINEKLHRSHIGI